LAGKLLLLCLIVNIGSYWNNPPNR